MAFTKVAPAGIGTSPGDGYRVGDSFFHATGLQVGGSGIITATPGSSTLTYYGDGSNLIGAGVGTDGSINTSGVITATSFSGDGSNLTSLPAGLGTALSSTQTDPLNKIYYTDSVLSVGATITINPPSSASAAYTQYTDIVADGADIIVADGDDFIPDILGISTDTVPSYSGSGGRVRAGKFTNTGANGAPTAPNGWIVTGVSTATTFKGNLIGDVTGNVTGTASQLETNATGANLTLSGNLGVAGTLTYEDVTRVDAVGLSTFREGLEVGPLAGIALTAYKDGSIRTTGVITATTYYGSGAQLTGIDASALKSGGSVKVQANSHGAVTTGVMTATSFAGSGANLTNLPASGKGSNLFINGAMTVDQRRGGAAEDFASAKVWIVDRFFAQEEGTQNRITVQQVDVTADTDPWNAGFRKAGKITNGNQNDGPVAAAGVHFHYKFEAQDVAQSGWDYTSASSYVQFSFWVKSSVAFTLPFYIRSRDGAARMYSSTQALSANTWTKITRSIPGDPGGLQIDNNNDRGLELLVAPYYGTDGTASGSTLNAWKAWTSSSRFPDVATTWWDQDDATLEFTGFKLEVGDSVTDYDFRTYEEELRKCQRYYMAYQSNSAGEPLGLTGYLPNTSKVRYPIIFNPPLRSGPSFSQNSLSVKHYSYDDSGSSNSGLVLNVYNANPIDNSVTAAVLEFTINGLGNAGTTGDLRAMASGKISFDCEL